MIKKDGHKLFMGHQKTQYTVTCKILHKIILLAALELKFKIDVLNFSQSETIFRHKSQ